jgi:hypothetical protein
VREFYSGAMIEFDLVDLHAFVVRAKKSTYVGDAAKVQASRADAFDLTYNEKNWAYRDSYFGGTDFLGQEVVWFKEKAVWAMNYHGTILRSDLFDGERAAITSRAALSLPHAQGRLLDNFEWQSPFGLFTICSTGDISFLRGRETIRVGNVEVYALDYQAGTVRE